MDAQVEPPVRPAPPSPPSEESAPAALEARGVTVLYGTTRGCSNVSLGCRRGEVHALLGENGAGKSTLMKVLAGLIPPTEGAMAADGRQVSIAGVAAAQRLGIRCVFQELSLVDEWTVAENLALGGGSAWARFSAKAASRAARATLTRWGLEGIDPRAFVSDLPLGGRQRIEIARAFEGAGRLVILDEASSALTAPEVDWLFAAIRRVTARGTAVLYSSHRMDEIERVADRGTVLRDGRRVGAFHRGGFDRREVIAQMAGTHSPDVESKRAPPPPTAAPVALEVAGLWTSRLRGVSLTLHSGEVVGLGGLQGNGQMEFLAALYGIGGARHERFVVAGRPVKRPSAAAMRALGVGFVPEERKTQGLALDLSVGENLLAPRLRPARPGGLLAVRRSASGLLGIVRRLGVQPGRLSRSVRQLSGGNQQKVVIGRWLFDGLRVLLLADPTRGIDIAAKHRIYRTVAELAESGVAVLWCSTDVDELVRCTHRTLVLYDGRVARDLAGPSLTHEDVVAAALGQGAPMRAEAAS